MRTNVWLEQHLYSLQTSSALSTGIYDGGRLDLDHKERLIITINKKEELRSLVCICKVLQNYISISALVLTSVPTRVVEAKLGERERPGKHKHVRRGQKFDILPQNHLMLLTKIKMTKVEMKIKKRSKV